MLKILAIIVVVVLVVIAGILIYASTRPDSFRVQRSVSIKAPPAKNLPADRRSQGMGRLVAL